MLLLALAALAVAHIARLPDRSRRVTAAWGWAITACALISPLCALSVSLFSARVAQHMVLVLIAAPLLALSLPAPQGTKARLRLWSAAVVFFTALWFWHMPVPYDATFAWVSIYWAMHLTLFGSAVWLWRELLMAVRAHLIDVVVVGSLTSMQMGLLGAVLAMASRPLYSWHFTTTQVWGLTPLQDQQLGGTFMWVPGIVLFLWAAVRALGGVRGGLAAPDTR